MSLGIESASKSEFHSVSLKIEAANPGSQGAWHRKRRPSASRWTGPSRAQVAQDTPSTDTSHRTSCENIHGTTVHTDSHLARFSCAPNSLTNPRDCVRRVGRIVKRSCGRKSSGHLSRIGRSTNQNTTFLNYNMYKYIYIYIRRYGLINTYYTFLVRHTHNYALVALVLLTQFRLSPTPPAGGYCHWMVGVYTSISHKHLCIIHYNSDNIL